MVRENSADIRTPAQASSGPKKGYEFGTFKGVFVPNILTILGVIMYLRFGWVLGHMGIARTLLIVTGSTVLTLITSFSISQLATNAKVGPGGAYYIISRSLGLDAGAAIGIPLFFSQAFSVAFYVAGFAESLTVFGADLPVRWIAIGALIVLTLAAYVSANLVMRAQFFILGLIVFSLVSFFWGRGGLDVFSAEPALHAAPKEHFWHVFAVFFPAVTGILAGLSMSGDLKSPNKSLPLGTIAAVLVSYLVYIAIPVVLVMRRIPAEVLMTNSFIMRDSARWGNLILFGLWGAALSSALGSLLGAPRTLQALAVDGVVPKLLGRGYGRHNNPRFAVLISFVLALTAALFGSFNAVASLLTMFFLTTYGLLNLAAALEGMMHNPSWRPAFKIHWIFPLLGALGCLGAMFMINAGVAFVAIALSLVVYYFMQQHRLNAYWGNIKYAVWMFVIRIALYRVVKDKPRERSWRPNLLVLSGAPANHWNLIVLADALSHGKGFLTVAAVLKRAGMGEGRVDALESTIRGYLLQRRVPALVKVHTSDDDVWSAAREIVRTYGFGPLEPNTVLLGTADRPENFGAFTQLLMTVFKERKNLVLVHEPQQVTVPGRAGRIDVWWRRQGKNAGLMLALAFLLKTSPEWDGAQLLLKTVVDNESEKSAQEKHLSAFVESANIPASVEVLVSRGGYADVIRRASKDASIVFMGLRSPGEEETAAAYQRYYADYMKALEGLPPAALVMTSDITGVRTRH